MATDEGTAADAGAAEVADAESTAPAEIDALAEMVLRAATDIGRLTAALDAERLLSMLLGAVYAAVPASAPGGRDAGFRAFLTMFRRHLADSGDSNAPLVGAVLDALAGSSGRPATPGDGSPAWVAHLGAVHPTGAYAYGDRYGDQTSYIATFAYDDVTAGGDEHAVVILADHNLGLAKDVFVAAPASSVLDQLRDHATTDGDAMTWFSEIEPATVRAAAEAYLGCTDAATEPPVSESFAPNRTIALARLQLLPAREVAAATVDPRTELIDEFIASPEADLADLAGTTGAKRESLAFCLSLFIDFGTSRGDALRWSPAAVDTFLGSWVHGRAIIDAADAKMMPVALRAWIAWSARKIDLPSAALKETLARVREMRDEFRRVCKSGERRSPAVRAMAGLVADGVDLDDARAVEEWLASYETGP